MAGRASKSAAEALGPTHLSASLRRARTVFGLMGGRRSLARSLRYRAFRRSYEETSRASVSGSDLARPTADVLSRLCQQAVIIR